MLRNTLAAAAVALVLAAIVSGQAASKPQTVNGLQITVTSVEHTDKAGLKDCPPGTNTVNSVQRPGDELIVVTAAFKVLPDFKPVMMKRPTATTADGKVYNTSVQFVDVGSMPEYSCQFVYRVQPPGTKLKTFTVENTAFDLTGIEK